MVEEEERISVSRDALKAELKDLELRLVDRLIIALELKADQRWVETIANDVDLLKQHGSPALVTAMRRWDERDKAITSLVAWRNKVLGALFLVTVTEPVITALMIHYL